MLLRLSYLEKCKTNRIVRVCLQTIKGTIFKRSFAKIRKILDYFQGDTTPAKCSFAVWIGIAIQRFSI